MNLHLLLHALKLPGLGNWGQTLGWSLIKRMIRATFPNVQPISTHALATQLEDPRTEKPLLLDTRAVAEYVVSHLPSAQRVDPSLQEVTDLNLPNLEQSIVTYCSVGYRSAAIAELLQKAGYTNVANLEGSLFQWANEGRPVYRNGQVVSQVHPYNQLWGRLLNQRWHTYEVPADAGNKRR